MKKVLVMGLSTFALLNFAGCSSSVTPEEAAEQICKIYQNGNIEKLAEIASDPAAKEGMAVMSKEDKKMASEGMKFLFGNANCAKASLTAEQNGHYVANYTTKENQPIETSIRFSIDGSTYKIHE
ncbi:MAG: hypothetical protein KU28_09565 [Sulfurovum sp. PC08-66]|nr:MAG: hypothetical protein KU28_09565 [Sulfurovum sp. PC08-66]